MADDRWEVRDRPILEAVASAEDEGQVGNVDDLVGLVGLEREAVVLGVRALRDGGFVDAVPLGGDTQLDGDYADIRLLRPGREEVGQWPSREVAGEALLPVLQERVDAASTPEERSRWNGLLQAATKLGERALGDLAVVWLKQKTGLDS